MRRIRSLSFGQTRRAGVETSHRLASAGPWVCLVAGWAVESAIFLCPTAAHADPNPPHTPSYYQGKQVAGKFNSQSPFTSGTPLRQVCENLATNTQFSGYVADRIDFVRGCVDESRVLLGLYNPPDSQ